MKRFNTLFNTVFTERLLWTQSPNQLGWGYWVMPYFRSQRQNSCSSYNEDSPRDRQAQANKVPLGSLPLTSTKLSLPG